MKKNLQADLDMDVNVPRFNVFFPNISFSLDTTRSALERAVREDLVLADLVLPQWGLGFQRMACVSRRSSSRRRRLGEEVCCEKGTVGHY